LWKGKGWYRQKVLGKGMVMIDKSLVIGKGVVRTKGIGEGRVMIDKCLVIGERGSIGKRSWGREW
jgi:hypothetical protein